MAVRTRHNTPVETLSIAPTVNITVDVAAYALAYGLEESAVWNDAAEHLANVATAAVREAVDRLGLGGITEHQGTRVSVVSYRTS